jgi:hypothetical protein
MDFYSTSLNHGGALSTANILCFVRGSVKSHVSLVELQYNNESLTIGGLMSLGKLEAMLTERVLPTFGRIINIEGFMDIANCCSRFLQNAL